MVEIADPVGGPASSKLELSQLATSTRSPAKKSGFFR
jgi:hypothetical protein